jgi:hypothetical protein
MGENGADIGPDDLETSPPRKPQNSHLYETSVSAKYHSLVIVILRNLSNGYCFVSLGVKRPGRDADHSPPPRAQVKKFCGYIYTAPTVTIHLNPNIHGANYENPT